jgi:hypothetical protein
MNKEEAKLSAIRTYRFWGGNIYALKDRATFLATASIADKRAIAKLTEAEFNAIGWAPLPRIKLRKGYVRPAGVTLFNGNHRTSAHIEA